MAYRRRYFEPFVGTTETLGDKAVTGDKIDEGAISTGKIADDAVTSEKIADGEVKSVDIGTGQVKTSDLADQSVTSPKLADNAVTTYKIAYQSITGSKIVPGTITTNLLADAPITRPISPGVATAEIFDGAVTGAKLAGDAVETAKIKDNAVTSPKIAPDSILAGDIAANAIEGPEIKDGVVGTDKLSTDAVTPVKVDAIDAPADGEVLAYDDATETFEWVPQPTVVTKHTDLTDKEVAGVIDHADDSVTTAKILDENVTEPKLEADFLRKYLEGRQVFYDDFLGAVLDNRWAQSGTAGGSADIVAKSKVHINTKAEINAIYRINWNGKQGIFVGKLPKFYTKFWAANAVEVNFKVFVGLWKDTNNYILFTYDPGVSANWRAHCKDGGGETIMDTGVPFAFGSKEFYFDVVHAEEVKFYINGVLKATINLDIPIGQDVEPLFEIESLAAALATLGVDNVIISAEPE